MAKIQDELKENALLASILISIIVTGALTYAFQLGYLMTILMFLVITGASYIGINLDDESK